MKNIFIDFIELTENKKESLISINKDHIVRIKKLQMISAIFTQAME